MDTDKVPGKRKNEGKCPGKNHYTNNATVRIQRNQAEKQRRDRLNDQIAQLATLVPPAVNASKPLDKVSILRLSASWMRLNYSCLNEKRFKSAVVNYLDIHHSLVSNLDILEKSINGFIIATTFSGIVLMCSRYAEEYIGYQNIDLLGHHISNFVLPKEKDLLLKKMRNLISKYKNGSSNPRNVVRVRMQQRPFPRSNEMRYRKMSFSLSIHSGGEAPSNPVSMKKSLKLGRRKDFGESAVILIFAEPVQMEPDVDVKYLEQKDCYFTIHGTQGEIIFADHRISTMTGYMPRDVLGNSAYQYIHSSDVPIALFAQKAMFESSDGTGMITYRLRIRDSSFIYLQTKGQIRYKDSTKEVRQFICCNILLNEEDGNRELKKFQDRYAPQLNASKVKRKEIKFSTASPLEANISGSATVKDQTVSFEGKTLKRKGRPPVSNGSVTDIPMEMEEPNQVEKSATSKLFLDLDYVNRVNNDRSHSLSSNSDSSPLSSVENSPKGFVANGYHGASQTVQIINCNKNVLQKTSNFNVQSSNELSCFNNMNTIQSLPPVNGMNPLQSISPVNGTPGLFEKPLIFRNDCQRATGNSVNSSVITSDLLLIPDEFSNFGAVDGEKTFFHDPKFLNSPDTHGGSQRSAGNITFSNNIEMLTDFFTSQDAFQNHEIPSAESSIIPDKNSLLNENGHGTANGNASSNYFSPINNMPVSQSVSRIVETSAPNTANSQANLDLSFLDQSVEGMALLSDLSDFYVNSFLRENRANQCQAEAISLASISEANCIPKTLDLNNSDGANSFEPDELGLYQQISSDSHISNNAHSLQQFNACSSHLCFASGRKDSRMTNGMLLKAFETNVHQTPILERQWQVKSSAIHCSPGKQNINGNIHGQLRANVGIGGVVREGHIASRNGMHQLFPGMSSQSAFLNHAQNEYIVGNSMANQTGSTVIKPLEGSKFTTLK